MKQGVCFSSFKLQVPQMHTVSASTQAQSEVCSRATFLSAENDVQKSKQQGNEVEQRIQAWTDWWDFIQRFHFFNDVLSLWNTNEPRNGGKKKKNALSFKCLSPKPNAHSVRLTAYHGIKTPASMQVFAIIYDKTSTQLIIQQHLSSSRPLKENSGQTQRMGPLSLCG